MPGTWREGGEVVTSSLDDGLAGRTGTNWRDTCHRAWSIFPSGKAELLAPPDGQERTGDGRPVEGQDGAQEQEGEPEFGSILEGGCEG
jgi:hypothetical protein